MDLLMASRPVFIPDPDGQAPVSTQVVDFQWFAGLSVSQKQKSISSLHQAAHALPGVDKVLEVSTKSPDRLGAALSAFNLSFDTLMLDHPLSVECAFQGSKVFEQGGPFTDIYSLTSREAKRDERLRTSGRLTGFHFAGAHWALEPQTAFYDWLYINALKTRKDLAEQLSDYSAFTDIEFSPLKSINCQAYSVALFVSLQKRNCLEQATSSQSAFLGFLESRPVVSARQNDLSQGRLF
jgi:hypothetical protein